MSGAGWQAEQFERHRARLRAVAYRMLGSVAEADDAVQDAWLRFSRADTTDIDNLGGWLTTVTARVCLNILRTRRSRREQSLDAQPHLPEPIISSESGPDPQQEALLGDAVGMAMLVVLDKLEPAERVAFVLHDVFGVKFDEIAAIVGRTTPATRQLASRARRRVRGATGVPDADLQRQHDVVEPSGRPRATATSRHCWPSWTPVSWSAPMLAHSPPRMAARCEVPRRLPPRH